MESILEPQAGRLDRHVRRTHVRISGGVSRHRISYSLEEALRLTNLSGEAEGRIYCFRRVSIAGVPGDAIRGLWMDRVQSVLAGFAAQAVHGVTPTAGAANAIYFNNHEEALETLLRNALHPREGRQRSEWFSASLLGLPAGSGCSQQIAATVLRLGPPLISPSAAAAILFSALGDGDPGVLLSSVPADRIRAWNREMEGHRNVGDTSPVELPDDRKMPLLRAVLQFGWRDSAVVWLAAQAVLSVAPGAWSAGTAVRRARSTLRLLEEAQRREPADRPAFANRDATADQLVFDAENVISEPRLDSAMQTANLAAQSEPDFLISRAVAKKTALPDRTPVDRRMPWKAAPNNGLPERQDEMAPKRLLGEVTQAAGLPFLLNVLRRLGIVAALEACPALDDADLATYIMARLAVHAGVAPGDPVLHCLPLAQQDFLLPENVLEKPLRESQAWPAGFAWRSGNRLDGEYLLRVWVLAVRRWCWRIGRLTAREIVKRNGRVWLTRSDLDVTLPLREVDIRIRRVGLDIDPGWLPWFGVHGRVVRFHYRDGEAETQKC